jgi:SAM-dependent methyltransferase
MTSTTTALATPTAPLLDAQAVLLDALEDGNRDAIWTSTRSLCDRILAAEQRGVPRPVILETLARARAVHAESPFVRRLQTWPRGYPGDFETVEYLVGGTNLAPVGTSAWWVEQIALTSPIAVQHRCKVHRQAEEIRRASESRDGARILILACGGGRDLQALLDRMVMLPGTELTLVDRDADAVRLAADRARLLGAAVTPLAMDVLRGLRRAEGLFDLVLAGGLFDYLDDDTLVLLLKLARRRLVPGATLFFTNIATGNPFRPWIEYLGNWPLNERDASGLRAAVAAAGFQAPLTVERDPTGLTCVARIAA